MCETNVLAALVPAPEVNHWLSDSNASRNYIFGLVPRRLSNTISMIEEVVFRRMDRRIADYLCRNIQGNSLHATHQVIASDFGTSREVVSRILKDLEGDQLIHAGRSVIDLLDRQGREQKADAV